ncbi:hypothetical protein T11_6819 [Trichinella zimbabwensis]|uniref:Uncharacterized protein n=1 Tax=Trichinella zimbabwensis TaxID=268475 RepID=A0A0V1H7T7_9BILA|nr:hypothetical protein T11_6819 [Trichinella zimbabwensis]
MENIFSKSEEYDNMDVWLKEHLKFNLVNCEVIKSAVANNNTQAQRETWEENVLCFVVEAQIGE